MNNDNEVPSMETIEAIARPEVLGQARRLRRASHLVGLMALGGGMGSLLAGDTERRERIPEREQLNPLPNNFGRLKSDGRGSRSCRDCDRRISANAVQCAKCAGLIP